MTTLTAFLLARIAEDQAVATSATPGPWQWWNLEGADQGWSGQGPNLETVARGPVYSDGSQGAAATVVGAWGHDAWGIDVEAADAAHIARHDPARVLAECEAKRRIVERHKDCGRGYGYCDDGGHGWDEDDPGCGDLADLAAVYADHPDYREEWRL